MELDLDVDDNSSVANTSEPAQKHQQKTRSFNPNWISGDQFCWAKYDSTVDAVFCEICQSCVNSGTVDCGKMNSIEIQTVNTFVTNGWRNFRMGKSGLDRHATCLFHKHAAFLKNVHSNQHQNTMSQLISAKTKKKR